MFLPVIAGEKRTFREIAADWFEPPPRNRNALLVPMHILTLEQKDASTI